MSATEALRRSRAVVVQVHGVGAHSASDMVTAAVVGHRAAIGQSANACGLLADERFALIGAWLGDEVGGVTIVPVVWSDLRPRLIDRLRSGSGNQAWAARVRLAWSEWLGLFSAATSASHVGWALAILAFAAVIAPLVLVMTSAAEFWFVPALLLSHFAASQVVMVVAMLWLAFLPTLFLNSIPGVKRSRITWPWQLLDCVFDVARYVRDQAYRAAAKQRVCDVVAAVRSLAPNVPVVVVGHSLGSVVVTQAFTGQDSRILPPDVLVTMGSPLRTMSRAFDKVVRSPDQIENGLRALDMPCRWINLWRDADVIGRSLRSRGSLTVEEVSLGDGAHQDYWSDARLWHIDDRLAGRSEGNSALTSPLLNGLGMLTIDESREFATHRRSALVFLLYAGCLAALSSLWRYGYLNSRRVGEFYPVRELGLVCDVLLVLAAITTAVAVAPSVAIWQSDREVLGLYRFWRPWVVRALVVSITGAVAVVFVLIDLLP